MVERKVMMMKALMVGLLAIPLVIALIYIPATAQAATRCGGGSYNYHDEVYYDGTINATAGSFGAQSFTMTKNGTWARVSTSTSARLLIMNDSQITNYTLGKNYTKVYDSKGEDRYLDRLNAGKYWIVLEAYESKVNVSAHVTLMTPAPKASQTACYDPIPFGGIQAGILALIICVASAATMLVTRH